MKALTFATRGDAETYIAEQDLEGRRKPQRVASRWYLVDNDKGTIGLSQFIKCAMVAHHRKGTRKPIAEVCKEASRMFRTMRNERRRNNR